MKKIVGCIINLNGTTSFVDSLTTTIIAGDPMAFYDLNIIANDTTDSLEIQVEESSGRTHPWSIKVKTNVSSF